MHFYLINDGNFRVTEKKSTNDELNASTLLACRQLLIDTGVKKILVDTGIGDKKYVDPYFNKFEINYPRKLFSCMTSLNIPLSEIDILVFTHLHFDHAGGFSRSDNNKFLANFNNSEIYIHQAELDHALKEMQYDNNSYIYDNLKPVFDHPKIKPVYGDLQICDNVSLLAAFGHTGGNQMVRFVSDEQVYYFAGDLLPTPYHINTKHNLPGVDHDPELHLINKVKLLDSALVEDAIIIFNHSPGISAGKIRAYNNGIYEFRSVKLKEISTWTVL